MHPSLSSQSPDEAIARFKADVRNAFAGICAKYGFEERASALPPSDNVFQVIFSNGILKIRIEGDAWGKTAQVYWGKHEDTSYFYSLWYVLQQRWPGKSLSTGSQTEQMHAYATYMETYTADILAGDTRFFDELEERFKKEKEQYEHLLQATIEKTVAEGGRVLDNPFTGEIILQKARQQVSYEEIKKQYPQSTDLKIPETCTSMPEEAIVVVWYAEPGQYLEEGELVGIVSCTEGDIELETPHAAKLLWVVPEGTRVSAHTSMAVIQS